MSFYDIIQALLGWLKNSSAFSAKVAQLYNSVYNKGQGIGEPLLLQVFITCDNLCQKYAHFFRRELFQRFPPWEMGILPML